MFELSQFVTAEKESSRDTVLSSPIYVSISSFCFRQSWILPQGTWTSPLAPEHCCLFQRVLAWVSGKIYTAYFSANFHYRLFSGSWKPITFLLKTLFRRCNSVQLPKRPQKISVEPEDTLVNSADAVYPRGGESILLGGHFWKAAFSGGPYLLMEIEEGFWQVSLSTKLEEILDLKIFSECFRGPLKMLRWATCGPGADNFPPLVYPVHSDQSGFFQPF